MSNFFDYKNNLATVDDTDRGPSRAIWADCPIPELQAKPSRGLYFFDDFANLPKTPATTEGNFGLYSQFSSAGGTINAGTGQGGEWVLGEATDNEGVSFRSRATAFKISRATKKFWWECRIKRSTVANTTAGIIAGLMDDTALTATVPIAADGTLADINFVGFHAPEGDGDQFDFRYRANGVAAVDIATDVLTTALAADTYVKLGMVYEPSYHPISGLNYVLTGYQNGRAIGTTKQIPSADGTDFPNDGGLGFVFAILLAAGSAFTATIDWWGGAQLYY